jgi:hypothetical protein
VSGSGLKRTTDYDVNGDGALDARFIATTALNANGSRTETVVRQDSGLKTLEKAVTDLSADERSVAQKWDVNGDGTFDSSRTDVTTLNANGSSTRKVSELSGATLTRETETTTSANGLSVTKRWDLDGNGTFDQSSTDVTALNGDGSVTRTVTTKKTDGSLIGETVETRSADGRKVTVIEDRTALGLGSRSLVSSKSTLADGSVTETLSVLDSAQNLKEKQTTTTRASGHELSIVRDVDADGKTDQTETYTRFVDGSQKTVITGYGKSGAKADGTTVVTSADGRITTTEWDLDGNGTVDRRRTVLLTLNADGSRSSTSTDTAAAGAVQGKTTSKTSADGRTQIVSRDLNGDGVTDTTQTTVEVISGAAVTTTVNNEEARKLVHLGSGDVHWSEAIAAKTEATDSTDGLTRTVRSDFDGNGTYEYVEVTTTQIDGSTVSAITETNANGTIKAKGTLIESADGRTTRLEKDSNNDGVRDQTQTAVTHLNGAITLTTVDWNTNGSVKETVTESLSATGKLTRRLTTDSAGRQVGELLLLADGTMTNSAYDGATGKLLSVTKLSKDSVAVTATFYDPLNKETWKEATQLFDAAGKLTKQMQTNDNGTKETTWHDVANQQTWTQQMDVTDVAGALTQRSYLNDDGTRATTFYDVANTNGWSRIVQYLDAGGKLTRQEQTNDNGMKETNKFDVANQQTWTQQTDLNDAAGALTQRSFLNDDNSRTTTFYDVTNAHGWSSLTQYLDAAGKLTLQNQTNDNGTKQADWYDVANAKTWTQQTDLYNAAGATTQRSFLNDDASRTTTFYDVTNAQGWSSLVQYLDTAGRLTRQEQTNDNGTKETNWWDVANQQTWSQQADFFNSAGARTQSTFLNDDNTRINTSYDVANLHGWSSFTQYVDAAGKLTKQDQINDSGTKLADWYDIANAETWKQQTKLYNAAGEVTHRTFLNDDNTKTVTFFDRSNTNGWSELTQYIDAAGKVTKQVQINDDGTKLADWYDIADAHAWWQQTDLYGPAGGLLQRSYLNDDKTRDTTRHDPANRETWTRIEDYYNSAGQLVSSARFNDGISRADVTYYDFNNSKSWARWSDKLVPGTNGQRMYNTKWDDGRVTSGKPPVLLDLNGDDHIDLRPFDPLATEGPAFDWDDDGVRDATAWVGPEDGILAIDLAANGDAGPDGVIDQARELAFASWAESGGVASDMEGLRLVFDTNHDNVLDMQDERWNEFRVWQDHNLNGVTDQGELLTMSEAGIKLVNLLPSTAGTTAFDDGSMITGTSSMTMTDGTTKLVADTTLSFRPSNPDYKVA